jgi:membrane fusion protein, heavy metal efflux system
MDNNFLASSARRAAFVLTVAALMVLAACSPKTEEHREASGAAAGTPAGNAVLTAAQRQHVSLFTVEEVKFRKSVDAIGAVDFDNDRATSVLPPFSGPVSRLLVSLGDRVKKGDALAEVDSADFATAIGTYQKALATAKTDRRLADLDKDLLEHKGVAEREALQAETDAVSAEADRDAAWRALLSLNVPEKTIEDIQKGRPVSHLPAMIRSPVTGTVAERLITPGELIEAGTTPCFTVADLSRVWVMAQIFGADIAAIGRGDSASVEPDGGRAALPGTVDNISALVDPNTRAVAVRVVVDNPGEILKKDMYVRVRIESRTQSSGLLIPVSAVLRDDENLPFVYVAAADGSFARRHVGLGTRAADRYEILSGLKAGEQIMIDGAVFVQFMQTQ